MAERFRKDLADVWASLKQHIPIRFARLITRATRTPQSQTRVGRPSTSVSVKVETKISTTVWARWLILYWCIFLAYHYMMSFCWKIFIHYLISCIKLHEILLCKSRLQADRLFLSLRADGNRIADLLHWFGFDRTFVFFHKTSEWLEQKRKIENHFNKKCPKLFWLVLR